MNKNKIINIIIILLLVFIMFLNNKVYARQGTGTDGSSSQGSSSDPVENPDYFRPIEDSSDNTKLKEKTGVILGAVNVVGVVVSVITLMIIGMKYMFGSVEEKAEYKKTATMYIIGAALVFSVTTISNILYQIGKNI